MSDFDWTRVITRLMGQDDLTREEARIAMTEIMAGSATPAQLSAFIVSISTKGETIEEITGFVDAMYEAAVIIDLAMPAVDLVGTGGDRAGTFNISTTAAFVAAGAGVTIAKHGNRAASSSAGSADLLAALGMKLDMSPDDTIRMIGEIGFGFFFAPCYHPAMRHAGPVRRELGVRTVFNFLGPLCHPANVKRTAIGVSDAGWAERMVNVLANRGTEFAFVYCGADGLDELTITGPSTIYRLQHGEITATEFKPENFGIPRASLEEIKGGDISENVAITMDVLEGRAGPCRDIVLINAASAVIVAGLADGFEDGIELAAESIDSRKAIDVLSRAAAFSASL